MRYVYLLQSEAFAGQRYVGITSDLRRRLADHNAGKSPHTSKYAPWRLVTYVAFSDEQKAETFERYLKSGSGHAFASKRLW
jgi:predicted GIY-YIG superfamily endonuclease